MTSVEITLSKQKSSVPHWGPIWIMRVDIPPWLSDTTYVPAGRSLTQAIDIFKQRIGQLIALVPPPTHPTFTTPPGPTDEQQLAFRRGFEIGLPETELKTIRQALEKGLPQLFQLV